MRKAQGISMNTIIIAALGLIVLIVLVLIFTGKVGLFSQNTSCTGKGGKCADASSGECSEQGFPIKVWADGCKCIGDNSYCKTKKGGQCCLPIG